MTRRLPLLLSLLVAGCGSRSNLSPGADGAAKGGGGTAGDPTGNGGAGAAGPGGAGAGGTGTGGTGAGGTGGAPPAISIPEACAIAVSCGRDAGWYEASVGYCVDAYARLGWSFDAPPYLTDPTLAARILECAQNAGSDCEAFRGCYGGDWVTLHRCREGAWCSGNALFAGPDGPTFECGAIGATCQDLWSGAQRACCNAEPCSQSTGVECDGTAFSLCGGWGEHITFDCGQSGRTCQSVDEAPCAGTGVACDPGTDTVTCDGSVATYCSGGKRATWDCAVNGYRTACNQDALVYAGACAPKGSACDLWDDQGICDGTVLVACIDGELTGIDCASLGFSGCEASGQVTRCVE